MSHILQLMFYHLSLGHQGCPHVVGKICTPVPSTSKQYILSGWRINISQVLDKTRYIGYLGPYCITALQIPQLYFLILTLNSSSHIGQQNKQISRRRKKNSVYRIFSSVGPSCLHLYSLHKGVTIHSFSWYKEIVKSKICKWVGWRDWGMSFL